jgi:excinuclease UvrABC helicase subunit UvrB
VPPQYVDSGLLVQIVKTVMEGMTGLMTQATPATQIPQVAVVNVVTTDNMVLLAQLVKSMREMGCNRIWGNKMQR